MSGNVYALLVGIDDYGGNPSSLHGCVADVEALAGVLSARVGEDRLKVRFLLDQDATREAVIESFDTHLGQAGSGDVAILAYSGHGSYELVEDRFWFLEPTGQNQTIVCADSRRTRVGDLADKELNELIKHVSDNGPHVLVILDCCHSGGGTRLVDESPADVHVRLAPPPDTRRPLDTYLPGVRAAVESAAAGAAQSGATSIASAPGLGHPRHVALSACEPTQLAKEIAVNGGYRGAFSVGLQRALTTMPDTATYRDLIGSAANAVRNRVGAQDPVAFVEGEQLDQPFLGGAVRPRPATVTLQHERDGWFIDVGSVHGIQRPLDGRTTELAVLGAVAEAAPPAPPLGQLRVVGVEPARSAVDVVGFEPDERTRYHAIVTSVPRPSATVDLRGDPAEVDLVRAALRRSVLVREALPGEGDDHPRFTVTAADGQLTVGRADMTPLTDSVAADQPGAERTAARLEHMARWHQIRDLENPTSALSGQIEIEIVAAEKDETPPWPGTRPALVPDETGVVRLRYRRNDDGPANPYVFVYLHNRSDRDLYCALLDLTDRYRSHSTLLPVEMIARRGHAVAFGGRPIPVTVPQERLEAGGTHVRDWLKLIASETTFESGDFDLPDLEGGLPDASRDLGAVGKADAPADWATTMVSLMTVGPADGVVLGDGPTELGEGTVTIGRHPAVAGARARLATTEAAARAADLRAVAPTALVRDPSVAVSLRLGSVRALTDGDAPDHLELTGDIDIDQVTPNSPLRLRLQAAVAVGDTVLAVARDGDLFLPLGTGVRGTDGAVELNLQRLPDGEPESESTRGLGRSFRIFFQRIIGPPLGLEPAWPRLSVARLGDADSGGQRAAELDHDLSSISRDVDAAHNALLVVHGLMGDTRTMIPALYGAVGGRYDVVLAFDFDSIGTSVTDNAEALAAQLGAVGLTADRGRPIDVVAVSTGALVMRWFAERLDGAALIRRAVLAGVPNDGSPWAAIQGWATSTLAIGLNGLAKVVWPAQVLACLVGALERLDAGVDDVTPGSALLIDLASPGGRAPAYTVLTGDSSLNDGAETGAARGRLGRLLSRLGRTAAELAFFRQPNDLLATTSSIRHFPAGLDPAPAYVDVACDHLTYLQHPDALAAITEALS